MPERLGGVMEVLALGLSSDVVFSEMATLARLKMAQRFAVPLDAVVCNIYLSGKILRPEFSVNQGKVELDEEQVVQVLREVWSQVKPELESRLADLRTCRG